MKAVIALLLALTAEAHITLWHPSLFGFNFPDPATNKVQNYNTNWPVSPLRGMDNLTLEHWFAHDCLNLTPAADQFLELEVGKANTFELACNRAFTTYGDPNNKKPKHRYACEDDTGPLHNMNKLNTPYDKLNLTRFGGTALGIAYTDDYRAVKPEDFTIISVNSTSPWYRLVDYQIPKDLPACPEKGCLCSWNWVHTHLNGEGYGKEFYNTLYRCKVTGDTRGNSRNAVDKPQVPVKCQDNADKCIKGAKQGMFMWMVNGNNMEIPEGEEPTYNMKYGFKDGAQDEAIKLNAKSGDNNDSESDNSQGGNSQDGKKPEKDSSAVGLSVSVGAVVFAGIAGFVLV